MKKSVYLLTVICLSLILGSCQRENTTNSIDEFNIELSDIDFSTLGKYSSIEELQVKMPKMVSLIFDDAKSQMEENNNINNIIVDVKFQNGTAYLNEVIYLDKTHNEIITRAVLDYNTMQFVTTSDLSVNGFNLEEMLGNTSKYQNLGDFAHSDVKNLNVVIGEVSNYLSKNLKEVQDCVFVKFNISPINVQINTTSC